MKKFINLFAAKQAKKQSSRTKILENNLFKQVVGYTALFFTAMIGLYLFMIFAGMAKTTGFTYSQF